MRALCLRMIVALALALPLAGLAHAASRNYEVDLAETTKTVKAGAEGKLAVHIRPAKGYKVNEKGPLSLKITAPEGLSLKKSVLNRADAQGEPTSPQFSTAFEAKEKGDLPVVIEATFILCDTAGTICEMKRERIELSVHVEA